MEVESRSSGEMRMFWGQSHESYDAAVQAAVETARETVADGSLAWLEVVEFRGGFNDGRLQYQVAVRIGIA